MFKLLEEINARPEPFSVYTAAELWTDPHTSSAMLAYHLDASIDVSSRKAEFIDRSVRWIISTFELEESKRVADFGCGPGLYTTRLAASGAVVTGIDFSERSIRYAREWSDRRGLKIDHVRADYLDYDTTERFDLITMIMCDFCALSPAQRQTMLDKYLTLLRPGGAVLLDAYSLNAYDKRQECATYAYRLLDGFWSAEPYFGFQNTFKYEQQKVVLDKYTIVEKQRTRTIYNWLQHYDIETLGQEVEARGFAVEGFFSDVAGTAFNPSSPELAIIARKPTTSTKTSAAAE